MVFSALSPRTLRLGGEPAHPGEPEHAENRHLLKADFQTNRDKSGL